MKEEAQQYDNPENFAKWGKINRKISLKEKMTRELELSAEQAA